MLNPEIVRLATRQIENKFADFDERLLLNFSRTVSEAASRGALNSGGTALCLVAACQNDIRVRAATILDAYSRAMHAVGGSLSKEAGDNFRELVLKAIDDGAEHAQAILRANTTYRQLTKNSRLSEERFNNQIREAVELSKRHVDTEVELFLASIAKPMSADSGAESGNVNIYAYGTVGAIQTGSGASASFSMNISPAEKSELLDALEALQTAIGRLDRTEFPPGDQALSAIELAKRELEQDSPNRVSLSGLLLGIGAAISAVADLQPAYQTLKNGASLLGINLS